MSCEVSLGDYDGESADVFHSCFVKARKPHRCFECLETIPVGQRYERVSGRWSGKWSTYRFCLPCCEIGNEFAENGRTFGVMWEALEAEWGEGANLQACLNRLVTADAKAHLQWRWMEWKGLR